MFSGVPDPPAGTPCVQSITRAGKAIVTWRSPPYDGGCAVTGYSVEMKRGEEPCWIAVAEARHSLSHTVAGLDPEETYRFRVRAENAHGVSEPSTVSDVVTVPGEDDEEIGGQVFVAEINQIEIEEEGTSFLHENKHSSELLKIVLDLIFTIFFYLHLLVSSQSPFAAESDFRLCVAFAMTFVT